MQLDPRSVIGLSMALFAVACGGRAEVDGAEGYVLLSADAREAGYALSVDATPSETTLPRRFAAETQLHLEGPSGRHIEYAKRGYLGHVGADGRWQERELGVDVRDDALVVWGDVVDVTALGRALGARQELLDSGEFLLEVAGIYQDVYDAALGEFSGASPLPLDTADALFDTPRPRSERQRDEDGERDSGPGGDDVSTEPWGPTLERTQAAEDDDLFTVCFYDLASKVTPLAFYRAEFDGRVQLGRTDENGGADFQLGEAPVTLELSWTPHARAPKKRPEFYDFYGSVEIPAESASDEEKSLALLRNNGLLFGDDLQAGLRLFQERFGHLLRPPLEVDGRLTARTRALMEALFESCPKDMHQVDVPDSVHRMRE